MKKRLILVIVGFFVVAVVVSLYRLATPVSITDSNHGSPELCIMEEFQWAKHWDELDLAAVKRSKGSINPTRLLKCAKCGTKNCSRSMAVLKN